MERYYVDDRCGCVAVRDRLNTDPDYQGLHSDTIGVVKFWMKKLRPESRICSHCGHATTTTIDTLIEFEEAREFAQAMNEFEEFNAPVRQLFSDILKRTK